MDRSFTVSADNVLLYCRELGEGEPLLMIHGVACDSDFFLDCARFLARRHRVILYDRRGYGRSVCQAPTYSDRTAFCRQQAEDAAAVIRKIGGSADICACSCGALIALHLAAYHPECVGRSILHEPPISDFIPSEHPVYACDAELSRLKEQSFSQAYALFLASEGQPDDRAAPPEDDALDRLEANGEYFLAVEQPHLYNTQDRLPPLPAGYRLAAAVGERSALDQCARSAQRLSEETGCVLLAFPGGHNAARELPLSFAAAVEGALSLAF